MRVFRVVLPVVALACGTGISHGDIYRWDTEKVIPGTEGITPGPGVQLNHRQLKFAELSRTDLTDANFQFANLTRARLYSSTLTDANLVGANLTDAFLSGLVTNADFTDADVIGTFFLAPTLMGFTQEQLYSTASYKAKDLRGIGLWGAATYFFATDGSVLTGWNFSGQDLTGAGLSEATLTDADLSGSNLTDASLFRSDLTNADFAGAVVRNVSFSEAKGFTKEQLYSTASYQAMDLRGIWLGVDNLSGWDFSGQDLTSADLSGSSFSNADLSGANLNNANLDGADIESAMFSAKTTYNQWTLFPSGFNARAAGLSLTNSPAGDFDANGLLDDDDLDLMSDRLGDRRMWDWLSPMFDLNRNLQLSRLDRDMWLRDLKHTWLGDANLDLEFNSGDLVSVLAAGQYEDDIEDNSGWATGDWDTDGDFTSADLTLALADGGYEAGRRTAVVPEPSALWVFALTFGSLIISLKLVKSPI